jgi:hypothetical protein
LIYNAGTGANTLSLAGGSARIDGTAAGGTLDTIVGTGAQLSTPQLRQNGLSIAEDGRVTLLPDGETSEITGLTLETGATLDIGDNALVLDYGGVSPVSMVREMILSGRTRFGLGEGVWTGTGITSSAAAAANQLESEARSVGYAENALLPLGAYTTFRGAPVDESAVLIAFTRTGDANLDGVVGDDDVTVLGAAFNPNAPGQGWAFADFDYDGIIEDDDVTAIGVFYNPSAEPVAAPLFGPVVAWSSFVAGSADHAMATMRTAGLRAVQPTMETFGRIDVRGQETRAQPGQETRAQHLTRAQQVVRDGRSGADSEAIDLVAESIAGESYESDRLTTSTRRVGRRLSAIDAMWATWG